MSVIEIDKLKKSYGDAVVLHELDLSIEKGELFGFLGPNGAGKTTTIKIMTGLLLPSSGSVTVAGYDVVEDPYEVKRRIGFVPDRPFLYDKLTGWEFLEFVGHLYRLDCDVVRSRSVDLITRFDLDDRIGDLVESYSHGMRQKLAMLAALVHDPEVLIIDEPTVGLDPRSTNRMKTLLSELVGRGSTVFLSTHMLEIAEVLCTRVAIIHQGRIVAIGSVDELRNGAHPSSGSLESIFLSITGDGDPAHAPLPA